MDEKRFSNILKRYTDRYDIRFCNENERISLMEFIDRYWRKNHILSQSQELLDWQYLNKDKHRYNFVLAICKSTNEIHGILGFISTSLFDSDIKTPMRWGTVWKIREDVASKGLGLALKLYMYQNAKSHYAGGIGLSRFSREINKKMGEEIGVMEHFYMVAPNIEYFLLADHVTEKDKKSCGIRNENVYLKECSKAEFENEKEEYLNYMLPYKSKLYYIKRYFEHPFYKYICIKLIDSQQKSRSALFFRVCEHEGANCIMITDFLGDEQALIGSEHCFRKLLDDYNAEYISFYETGLKDSSLFGAGFKKRKDSDIVLPFYFEPFERKNIDIDFHYYNDETVERKLYFFKGDADQDRPNIQ